MPLPSDLESNYHIHICVQTCTCIYCHCFKCFPLRQFDVPYYKIYHPKDNSKQNNGFIPFLYNGTYFKCIQMRYITARDTRGAMIPKIIGKIIIKACLKINKEVIFNIQSPKMKNISARDAVGTMVPNEIISRTCLKIINEEFIFSVQLPKKLSKQEAYSSSLLPQDFESTKPIFLGVEQTEKPQLAKMQIYNILFSYTQVPYRPLRVTAANIRRSQKSLPLFKY